MNRSIRRAMCAGMLCLQSVVLFLTGVVLIGLSDLGAGTSLAIGGGLAVACIVGAGMMRRPAGYWIGHLIQVVTLGLGFVVPTMFFLGVLFSALWFGAYVLGTRIDEERAEREVLEAQWRAEHGGEASPAEG